MKRQNHRPRAGSGLAAFTLVEMLIIIAIISILMTLGAIGLGGLGGKGVTSGVATAEALFDEARTTATGRNLRACVLVAKELDNNPSDDLRRILVATEEVDANGVPKAGPDDDPVWILSSRGTLLPDHVYFSETLSKRNHSGGSGTIPEVTGSKVKGAGGSSLSGTSVYRGTYFVYEFNAEGICATPGASFVIGNGSRRTNESAEDAPPRVNKSGKRDFGGFVVWRNGRTSVFRSPDQISENLPETGSTF
ncbi:MAG: hypothetical protein KDN05_12280 [Verrucomicrobiae bacterium]|nr:hypothetical protein [Verrucomicrobiae bacterium]